MSRRVQHRVLLAAVLATGLIGSSGASTARAQAPDLREIRPDVLLLVDTSMSMDYAVGSASGATGQLPVCTGNASSPSGRSRWITLLEALTGTYSNYYCTAYDRRTSFVGAPDQFSPHTYAQAFGTQNPDGVLDTNIDRARFGLMTFDNLFGLTNLGAAGGPSASYMVPTTPVDLWAANASAVLNAPGDYSYGNAYPLRFPGCTTTYMVNGGARRARAGAESFGGSLISVGPVSQDVHLTNGQIQAALLGARPFGSTPTGAMLDDLRYYLRNDPDAAAIAAPGGGGDPYAACRDRYAILITDGESSDPYRTSLHCDVGAGSSCPYELPTTIATDLCRYDGTRCTGLLDGLFVVAFATSAGATGATCTVDANCSAGQVCISGRCSTVTAELNTVARNGGTDHALLAVDLPTLRTAISNVLDLAQPGTTTRTGPAFTLSAASYAAGTLGTASAPQEQYQMNSGFNVSDPSTGRPWSGTLDRTRYVCDATLTPVAQPLSTSDHFADVLNARNLTSSPRRLYTALAAAGTPERSIIRGNVASGLTLPVVVSDTVSATTGASLATFDASNVSITPQHLGLAAGDTVNRTAIFDYVHGRAPAARAAARLGDIYHSTPTIVTAPRVDIDDQAYALFRQRTEIAGRPSMVYVGTNDGILHAFTIEDDPTGMARWTAGQELWGFVPPALLPGPLDSARSAHQFMVDGTPIVRDVVFRRQPGDAAASDMYHSVLLVGLRGGGRAYVALDVSDPTAPTFLWQWTEADMGLTYARPALGQALVNIGGVLQERAIAILPGGAGTLDPAGTSAGCTVLSTSAVPASDGVTSPRNRRRCWLRGAGMGQSLTVVDVATGQALFTRDHTYLNSPMTGGVALYSGDLGQFATRAFMADADGVVWRLDMSLPTPSDWTLTPMHDLFWADAPTAGQPVYDPPIVTVDNAGNPVVVAGAGDIDNLEGTGPGRIASITELVDRSDPAHPTSSAKVNWEVRLQNGEQVTGPMTLYANYVYFSTFQSQSSPTDACQAGQSRIWGLHFVNAGGTPPVSYSTGVPGRFPMPGLPNSSGTAVDTYFNTYVNQIVVGLGITQRPNCTTGAAITDTYLGSRYQISNLQPGAFQLVAQVSQRSRAASSPTATPVQTVVVNLQPPAALSRAMAYQPSADF